MISKRGHRAKQRKELSLKGIDGELRPQLIDFIMGHRFHPRMVEYYMSATSSPKQEATENFEAVTRRDPSTSRQPNT